MGPDSAGKRRRDQIGYIAESTSTGLWKRFWGFLGVKVLLSQIFLLRVLLKGSEFQLYGE